MNQRNRSAGNPSARRNFKLAPTTHAIRSALAASAVVLALAGSNVALAGTCAVTGLNEVTCNGVFIDDVANTVPVINLVPDLTLVVGDDGSTTVDPAAGVSGISSTWGGDATVVTYAEITTDGADGVYMYSNETATFDNQGVIQTYVSSAGSNGVDVSAYGDVSVVNGGFVDAYNFSGYDVYALVASSYAGNVDVDVLEGGAVFAFSGGGGSATSVTTYANGDSDVQSAGSIGAFSYFDATGVNSGAAGDSHVGNTGDIEATSVYSLALGVVATSFDGDATVYNGVGGSIEAYSYYGRAYGVVAVGEGASVDNDGSISATGYYYAVGVGAYANGDDATLINSGSIYSSGELTAFGAIVASTGGNTWVDNAGGIVVVSDSIARGVLTQALSGSASVVNSGSIEVEGGNAIGVSAAATDVDVYNTGSISASAYGYAFGIQAVAWLADATVDVVNTGDVYAYSYGSVAMGITVGGTFSGNEVTVDNSGTVTAVSPYGNALGINATMSYGTLDVANSGDVLAYGGDYATGVLVYAFSDTGVAIANSGAILAEAGYVTHGILVQAFDAAAVYVSNSGTVTADSEGFARGISVRSDNGDIAIVNTGGVYSYGGDYNSIGIRARTFVDGSVSVDNSGTVVASSDYASAHGIYAMARGGGTVDVDSSGDISAYGYSYAFGMNLNTIGGGDIVASNSGNILAVAADGSAFGIETATYTGAGSVAIYNSGSVDAQAVYGNAYAVHTSALGADFYLYNDGEILAQSVYGNAYGVDAEATGTYATATVVNVGSIDAISAYASATSVQLGASGTYGVATLDNAGSISADAYYGTATGAYVYANGLYGEATIVNSGSVYAVSGYGAYGVVAAGGKYAGLDNSGSIDAVASNGAGAYAIATGAGVSSFYGEAVLGNSGSISALAEGYAANATGAWSTIYGGNARVDNSGSIAASAYGELAAQATGVAVSSSLLSAVLYNSGSVQAYASADYADAVGAYVSSGEFALVETAAGSSISAVAVGYTDADATGADVTGLFANLYGEGSISAEASADAVYGDARAYGAYVYGSFTGIYVLGDGALSATAEGAYALAVGVVQNGYFTAFHNEGSIYASATGEAGFAVGALTISYYGANLYNDGDISAVGSGEGVEAVGLFAASVYGDADLYNTGSISASADYLAVAVQLRSAFYTYVYNTGTIEASGADTNVAIYAQGPSTDTIYNYGTITGALWLGEGDDYLYNDGTWNAGQTPSYFGAGDDGIMNTGTINMDSSIIDLGTFSAYGNFFYNYGTINVNGAFNHIDMGGPMAAIPSLNPLPFYNYGTIDFQDGAANDYLLITGDFAGDGDINVDVSGLNEVSDVLYIDGSVVTGTVNTINVDLLDLPDTIESLIPIVYVTGVSVAGNFVLGDIDWDEDNSFVSLDFGIVADIDATNATPDVFSLGIEVTGLSDPGTIAASIPGSVVSLMNSQVGTWRQRMGVIDSFSKGAIGLWARVFTDKGSFSPEHAADNFGNGGNFDWEQKNSGVEAGIDFSVTDEFSLGLLVAKSEADVHLDNPGVGSSDLDADTWGVYGTWISPNGFYLDASYRWMSFDVDLNSVAGAMQASGDAESFNIEVGYAWTLAGGLKIEPQLQWTKTNVDNLDVLSTTTGMTFTSGGGDSSRGRLGVAIRKSFGDADTGWQWTPYATLSAVREFDGESDYAINNTFFGASTIEGTSTLLELGFTARHQNLSIYGGLNWQDGGAINSFFGGQLGVRYTFGGSAPPPAPVVVAPAKTCADLDDDGDGVNNCDDKCLGSTAGQAVGPDGCPVPAPEPEPVMEPKPFRG